MHITSFPAEKLSNLQAIGETYSISFIEHKDELIDHHDGFILGKGTNTLLLNPQKSPIYSLSHLNTIEIADDGRIKSGAGALLPALIHRCQEKGLGGLEFIYAVPTTLGGAIVQNFGAYGQSIDSFVEEVEVYNPKTNEFQTIRPKNKPHCFGYRSSLFKEEKLIVISATLRLPRIPKNMSQTKCDTNNKTRNKVYPLQKNIGSIFKNPEGNSAGKLLDEAGLKGQNVGGAIINPNHANIILNHDHATTQDVADLIEIMHDRVLKTHGVELEREVVIY